MGPSLSLTDFNANCQPSAPKTATKRIFLITDQDDPHLGKGSQQLMTSAQTTLIVSSYFIRYAPFLTNRI
jgi:hypothetical protein